MTDKQKAFVMFYLESLNGTKAAIAAGYSKKTAYSIGQRLLKKVEIKKYIEEKLKAVESGQICKAQEVLEFLTAVMRGQVTEDVVVQVGSKNLFGGELLEKPPSIKDRITAAAHLAKFLKVGEEQDDHEIKIRIIPAQRNNFADEDE